jgi:plasmid stabilization system protein ParE
LKVEFAPLAKEQIRLAQAVNKAHSSSRAKRFAAEIRRATRLIGEYPYAARRIRNFRRLVLSSSLYSLLYAIEEDHVLVLELVHQKQEPDYLSEGYE